MPRWISLLRRYSNVRSALPVYAVLAVGIALSVFVLAWLTSLRGGFLSTFAASGRADQAIVLSRSASSEVASFLAVDKGLSLIQHAAVARNAEGIPLASAESFSIGYLPIGQGDVVSVSMRGLTPFGVALRSKLKLTSGRLFVPGTRELLAGTGIMRRLPQLRLGQEVMVRGTRWTIVGTFETGDAAESEFWGDINSVQNALRQGGFQAVYARFVRPEDLDRFRADVGRDKALNAKVMSEREYYAANSVGFPRAVGKMAMFVGIVMAIAAAVNASNSMLYLVDRRRKTMALLLSLGFTSVTVFLAVMMEAVLVAVLGGCLGWVLAFATLDGHAVNAFNMQSYELVVFNYSIGWQQGLVALALVLVVVVVGSCAVAWKMASALLVRLLTQE